MTTSDRIEKLNHRRFIYASIALYFIAGFTPIFIGADYPGFDGLLYGWMALFDFDSTVGLPWLANIFFFANLILRKLDIRIGVTLSFVTILLGLFAIGITEVPVNEGGTKEQVTVGFGFGLWMLSFFILLSGQLVSVRAKSIDHS